MPTFSANATFDNMRPSFCRQARIFLSFAVSVIFRPVSVPSGEILPGIAQGEATWAWNDIGTNILCHPPHFAA